MVTAIRKRHAKRYTARVFDPYTKAIGQLALAWNDLHESLAALFATIMLGRPPTEGEAVDFAPLFVWYSSKSDRAQREMLRGAIRYHQPSGGLKPPTVWASLRPILYEEVKWLLDRSDALEEDRNNAIHSPLFTTDGTALQGTGRQRVMPAFWQFHPRAMKLNKKEDLLIEFRLYRDIALSLADYAHLMDVSLTNPASRPWPDRPSLPTRERKTTHPNQKRRQRATK